MNYNFPEITNPKKWLRGVLPCAWLPTPDFPACVGGSLMVAVMLGGCTTPSETFDCPAGKGVGCTSISEVNHRVNQGILGASPETTRLEKGTQPSNHSPFSAPIMLANPSQFKTLSGETFSQETPSGKTPSGQTLSGQAVGLLPGQASLHRLPEEPLKIWVAPFQDDQGNFHEASVVHTVLKPGRWQVKATVHPVREEPDLSLEALDEEESR